VEGLGTAGVGEVYAESRSSDGEVEDLTQGCVCEVFRRQRVVGLGDLLRGSPGGDPVRCDCGVRLRECYRCECESGEEEERCEFLCVGHRTGFKMGRRINRFCEANRAYH
jgi:hypothetical protein